MTRRTFLLLTGALVMPVRPTAVGAAALSMNAPELPPRVVVDIVLDLLALGPPRPVAFSLMLTASRACRWLGQDKAAAGWASEAGVVAEGARETATYRTQLAMALGSTAAALGAPGPAAVLALNAASASVFPAAYARVAYEHAARGEGREARRFVARTDAAALPDADAASLTATALWRLGELREARTRALAGLSASGTLPATSTADLHRIAIAAGDLEEARYWAALVPDRADLRDRLHSL